MTTQNAIDKAIEALELGLKGSRYKHYLENQTLVALEALRAAQKVDVETLKKEIAIEWERAIDADPQYKFHQPTARQTIAIAVHYLVVKGLLTPKTPEGE